MSYFLLLIGLVTLIAGGEFLVRGAVGVAQKFRLSSLVIGMTVVSFGTSAPELIVSIKAALYGSSEIAMGNVIGSNIANIALVLGITVLIFPNHEMWVSFDELLFSFNEMRFSFNERFQLTARC